MNFPLIFKLLIPIIIGVVVHFYTGFSLSIWFIVAELFALFLLSLPILSKSKKGNLVFGVLLTLFAFTLGGFVAQVHDSSVNPNYFANKSADTYLVQVIEMPEEKAKSVKCVVDVLQVGNEQVSGKSLLYFQKSDRSQKLKYGDLITVKTNFQEIKSNGNPKEFDYARYLRIHNIHEQGYVKEDNWGLKGNDANPFLSAIFSWRQNLSELINDSGMSPKNAMVANALLLGQKEYLDKDVLRSYSSAGAMHVLAVSGLHVGIVMLILMTFLKPFKKLKFGKNIYVIALLSGIWFYAFITGLSPSVMRAAVMFSFIIVGQELQRETNVYQSIMVSAFLLILTDPYIIFQVGFQLSYLAVLGIVYLQPKIENLFYVKNKILYKAWQISAVSIAAQIATFPLGLYYFHQFPNFFLLSNLLVIPMAFFILIVGMSYLILHIIPLINDLLLYVLDVLINVLNFGVEWVEKLPYSILWGISIEWYEVFLIYISLFLGAVSFIHRKSKALIASLSGCLILLVFNVWENNALNNENSICIYNVSDEVAIDVFQGRNNTFFATKEFMDDEEKLLFHVKHNWFYRTGNEQPSYFKSINNEKLISAGGKKLLLLNQELSNELDINIPVVDYVVLHDIEFIKKEWLDIFASNNVSIVIGPKVKYGLREFISNNYLSSLVHNLKEDGAFEIRL
ncbi:competence protein ComEC family protein [Paracrocinitomix mangrovi]|uniref:ComEC/Rec2 family competence protein n=1 Tax=Paracrocinitomix mangrovi TaxID=2862509 RepID=UPI001C8D60F0|nr:ComEC/Rec2 family competence protein [Paracrocinitomix mangrovi]UKN01465.1 competence protein ComEC family protein [Paracrocinitomix mangrovi]